MTEEFLTYADLVTSQVEKARIAQQAREAVLRWAEGKGSPKGNVKAALRLYRAESFVQPIVDAGANQSLARTQFEERFPAFLGPYQESFPLADEAESPEGFKKTLLEINYDPAFKKAMGPFEQRAFVLYAPDTEGTAPKPVGGAYYIVYPGYRNENGKTSAAYSWEQKYAATAHIFFVFLEKSARGLGLGRTIIDHVENDAVNVMKSLKELRGIKNVVDKNILFVAELNDPMKLTPYFYLSDGIGGSDAYERLQFWQSAIGMRPANFYYVSAPLMEGQPPCDFLQFNAYAKRIEQEGGQLRLSDTIILGSLASETILAHVANFFRTNALKSIGALDTNEEFDTVKRCLTGQETIQLKFTSPGNILNSQQRAHAMLAYLSDKDRKALHSNRTLGDYLNSPDYFKNADSHFFSGRSYELYKKFCAPSLG